MLEQIMENTRRTVRACKEKVGLSEMRQKALSRPVPESFCEALAKPGISLIAEAKKASPSAGIFVDDYDPAKLARIYQENGAGAISVLTQPTGFLGDKSHIRQVVDVVSIPVIQKDFFIDEYQIYESKVLGASAVLLIAAILTDDQVRLLLDVTETIGLDAVVEIHTEDELDRMLDISPKIIGINNRDLKSFNIDLATSQKLSIKAKSKGALVIAESGVRSRDDMTALKSAGFDAVLIGTSIVKAPDPGLKIKELLGE